MAKKSFFYHLPWIGWLILITVLCITPGDKLPKIEWQLITISTFAHFSMYFGLSALMLWGIYKAKKNTVSKFLNLSDFWLYIMVISIGISYGYLIELIQGNFIYQRYYDTEDIIVNGIGTIFGVLGYILIGKKLV
ncbi:VanZ family protein [Paracrocinitomix mangrovi]|uniref:VanZ family protein n=1 Tax=Paracrocinitomix mangrovi TaxID=2862509 RepID=UPI001C8E73F6|nr:VanZ family protein [Paracrocinitomix mangrovi]UKN03414.1 VanZ family protein [Paracrocinitomix mangrovi]